MPCIWIPLQPDKPKRPLVLPDSLQSDTAGNRIFYPSIQGLYVAACEDRFPVAATMTSMIWLLPQSDTQPE